MFDREAEKDLNGKELNAYVQSLSMPLFRK